MELTRDFVATVYVVEGGATALHEHDGLGMWLPPGGHVERAETPREAALRETREEVGLDVELLADRGDVTGPTVEPMARPQHLQLEDINVCDGEVGHQHMNFVYYGESETRAIDPGPGEAPADAWEWFDRSDLDRRAEELAPEVRELAGRAIRAVEGR